MRIHIKFIFYLVVLAGFSSAQAGSYEDFFAGIKRDNPGTIRELLSRGFDPNTLDPEGSPGLYLALLTENLKAANVLIDWPKTNVDIRTPKDESPLMIAALKGHLDLVKKLIAKDADVNKPGWAPLHYAATGAHLAIMELLLEHHAFIDAESPNGTTPLMMAAQYGNAAAVKLLLDAGADATMKNQLGLTAIDFAKRVGRDDSVELIIKAMKPQRPKGQW
jgi:uncharacterized protein